MNVRQMLPEEAVLVVKYVGGTRTYLMEYNRTGWFDKICGFSLEEITEDPDCLDSELIEN